MAYGDFTKITELEAVNICLGVIGETPVSTIPVSGVSEATIARDLLYEKSRDVQTEGQMFNTREDYTLTPDVDGYIALPSNTLQVDSMNYWNDYIEYNGQLYDRDNNTNVFSSAQKVVIVTFEAWTAIPQHVRQYIVILAARAFQERFVADSDLWKFTQDDEDKAKRQFQRIEDKNANFSIFDNGYLNRGVLRRSN